MTTLMKNRCCQAMEGYWFVSALLHVQEKKDDQPQKVSKKKLRRLNRISVAQLKQLVERPDLVEMHDVSAHDPKLLIQLKVPSLSLCLYAHVHNHMHSIVYM